MRNFIFAKYIFKICLKKVIEILKSNNRTTVKISKL